MVAPRLLLGIRRHREKGSWAGICISQSGNPTGICKSDRENYRIQSSHDRSFPFHPETGWPGDTQANDSFSGTTFGRVDPRGKYGWNPESIWPDRRIIRRYSTGLSPGDQWFRCSRMSLSPIRRLHMGYALWWKIPLQSTGECGRNGPPFCPDKRDGFELKTGRNDHYNARLPG